MTQTSFAPTDTHSLTGSSTISPVLNSARSLNADGSVYLLGSVIDQRAFIRVSIGSMSTADRNVVALQERIKSALATPANQKSPTLP